MDMFGSNATALGGAAGRADAMIGAVEAQKAEGVVHVHLFLYIQMILQYSTLKEVADQLQKKMCSAEAVKAYISHI